MKRSATNASNMNLTVLIPAFNPDHRLAEIVEQLLAAGFGQIVVIDDGSRPECAPVFEKVRMKEGCHLLRHAINCGKGRALKTGFNYCRLHFPDSVGVITCDADGQHQLPDGVSVAGALRDHPDSLVIGTRDFSRKIPLRSKLGNKITKLVFFLFVGKYLSDTQSGLRGIPMRMLPLLIRMDGEGYEYEMNMLIATKAQSIPVVEEKISTIYIDDNKSSHFNPLLDSMRIYFLLLRFAFSSLLASIFDFILFSISYGLTSNILASILVGRYTVGPFINYSINRNFVFHYRGGISRTLVRYYLLASVMGVCAYFLVSAVSAKLGMSVYLSKILVESFLFLASFAIQRDFIFVQRPVQTASE
jgi:glycosyltransferase involved in cell wall biosynthesis